MAKRVFNFAWKGKPWTLKMVPAKQMDEWAGQWHMDGLDGLTTWQEQTVQIATGLTYNEKLETVIHELLHVAFPGSSLRREREVDEGAKLIVAMLKEMELVNG